MMNPRPLFLSHPCPYCGAVPGVRCHQIVRTVSGCTGSRWPRVEIDTSHRDREPVSRWTGDTVLSDLMSAVLGGRL